MPRGGTHARGLDSHYRQDVINDISRRLFVQSSPNHSYDSLTSDHHSPPRRTTPPRGPPPPPPPPRGPTPEGPGGPTQDHVQQAVAALQSIYGPSFQDEDLLREFQGLMARVPVASAIETVENDASEDGLEHNAAEADAGLWSRDVSGRLQHGATGGSAEASDSHF